MTTKAFAPITNSVRIIAAILFGFLMVFNVQLSFDKDNAQAGDVSLAGIELSAYVPSAVASGGGGGCGGSCSYTCYWDGNQRDCMNPIFVYNCCGCPGAQCSGF